MKDVIMITYTESGDEIHFMLVDIKHKGYIDKVNLEGKTDEGEFLEFIYNEILEKIFVQTYTTEKWFEKYNIVEVISLPYFGC